LEGLLEGVQLTAISAAARRAEHGRATGGTGAAGGSAPGRPA